MLSNQKLQNSLNEIKEISHMDTALFTAKGKLVAHTEEMPLPEALEQQVVVDFAESLAEKQTYQDYHLYKVMVEGETAVVKAEEGNTVTEQEPEAAPALSEEELNAMYERFQQRLQKEGLADADGKPTEKTLEIRRQIVEKKVEREKQAEKQKKIAKRAKTTKHWVRTAKAAGVVLVVGACVFGASMTSEANLFE